MITTTAILWGLLGAILIGVSDCIARVTAKAIPSSVLFLFIMGCSTAVLLGTQIVTTNLPPFHAYAWTVSAISGILNLVALYFLYKALARGPVTVASPAASTFVVMLVLLNALAGQPWTIAQLAAVGLVFIGVSQLARHSPTANEDRSFDTAWLRTTAFLGLAAAAAVTVRMFMAQEAGDAVGAFHALTLNRGFAFLGAVVLTVWLILRASKLTWPKGRMLRLVLLQTLLETLALGAFLIGSSGAGRVGATIGFSAFSAVTAITAWVWLGEPIGKRRAIWMLLVAGGLALGSMSAIEL